MDENTEKEIKRLRNIIGDLQTSLLATLAEVKALRALSVVLWEKQGIEMANGRTISEVLDLLKNDVVDDNLKKLADTDMVLASKLKRRMEKFLKKKNS